MSKQIDKKKLLKGDLNEIVNFGIQRKCEHCAYGKCCCLPYNPDSFDYQCEVGVTTWLKM